MLSTRDRIFNKGMVNRGDSLTLTNPVQSLYMQNLFDLESSDTLISLYHLDNYHPIWNILNMSNTNVYSRKENFLSWMTANQSGEPADFTSPVVTDPCAVGNGFDYGFCSWEVEDFNRLRRSTPVRDLTRRNMKLFEKQAEYDIAGNRITNDWDWDTAVLGKTVLQDMHRQLMSGSKLVAGEVDGILNLIKYGYTNPQTDDDCIEMDSYVVDWDGAYVCDFSNGNPTAEINGVVVPAAIGANLTMIDLIKAYVMRVAQRISVTSVRGTYQHIALVDVNVLQDLIDCYVCYTVCGRDISRMDSFEARTRNEQLQAQLGEFGAVTLTFNGYPVTFMPWAYDDSLYDAVADEYTIVFLIPRIGNYPVWEIEFLDMQNALRGMNIGNMDFQISDMGRWLHMETTDWTCYRRQLETQFRVLHRAPWTSMKITGIKAIGSAFGRISLDPQSPNFYATLTSAPSVTPL